MIYNALMVPTESPPTLREIKRALITYDKLTLIDPADRDLIPSSAWIAATMPIPLPFIPGIVVSPIRPMGKVIGYDEKFERTFDACRSAREQGLIELKSTYTPQPANVLAIGFFAGARDYPLPVRDVLLFYRAMARQQEFLRSALQEDAAALIEEVKMNDGLARKGLADGTINDAPALPSLEDAGAGEHGIALSMLARARVGAFIKYAGYCDVKNLVPVMPSHAYGGLTRLALEKAAEALGVLDDPGDNWARTNRVLDVCHEEFMLDELLDAMSVDDVIKLRSTAWGNQAEAREKLFESVRAIAREAENDDAFDHWARGRIAEYRRESDEVATERRDLKWSIACDLIKGAAGAGAAQTTLIQGLNVLLQAPIASIGLGLAVIAWGAEKTKEYRPQWRALWDRERELKRGAGFGLHNFYSRLKK